MRGHPNFNGTENEGFISAYLFRNSYDRARYGNSSYTLLSDKWFSGKSFELAPESKSSKRTMLLAKCYRVEVMFKAYQRHPSDNVKWNDGHTINVGDEVFVAGYRRPQNFIGLVYKIINVETGEEVLTIPPGYDK